MTAIEETSLREKLDEGLVEFGAGLVDGRKVRDFLLDLRLEFARGG